MDLSVLIITTLVMGVIAATLTVTYVISSFLLFLTRRRRVEKLAIGDEILRRLALSGQIQQSDSKVFKKLGPSVQLELIGKFAAVLAGDRLPRLRFLAEDCGLVAIMQGQCRSRFWWRRLQAVRCFSLIGGSEEHVESLLDDRNNWVRSESFTWVADNPTPRRISALIDGLLGSDNFSRHTAKDALIRSGIPIANSLVDRANTADSTGISDLLTVAASLGGRDFIPLALRYAADANPDIRTSVARALGTAGGQVATTSLMKLSDDADAVVRKEACQALGALGSITVAPTLLSRLSDVDWDVRQISAVSLINLGAGGELLLQLVVADKGEGWHQAKNALDSRNVLTESRIS